MFFMKKVFLILLISLMIVLTACAPDPSTDLQNNITEASEKIVSDTAKQSTRKASQELMNFKCTIDGDRTFYFLKGNAKIVSSIGSSWIVDDKYYMRVKLERKYYLIKYPIEKSSIDAGEMIATYQASKTVDNLDCELNAVKESDVALPDLEIITPEEIAGILTN